MINKESKKMLGLFARYFFVFLLGIGNLYIIYKILTPLTIHILNLVLRLFTKIVSGETIIHLYEIGIGIEIVPACVAGSAFYLILILIMSTANIKPEIRARAIITAFMMLFVLNIIRIMILIPMAMTPYFEVVHWIFWHLISIVFVICIWFVIVKIYKIKSIPVYTDILYLNSLIKFKKSKKGEKSK